MINDIIYMLKLGDFVDVTLVKPLTPHCVGSETHLFEGLNDNGAVTRVMGDYFGHRPGLIRVNPTDEKLLDAPRDISRYVVIDFDHIKEVNVYGQPKKIFP
jgi:hypothetical protein